tara:strand:+ start:63 stop:425 length:363 start_codon:yes stop_codon:yes gene_type:complete
MSKYGNRKVKLVIDGIARVFDSVAERSRAVELINDIGVSHLEFQPKFLLLASFKRNGKAHRAINYVADFSYTRNAKVIIEDVKGMETDVYKIKKKLFLGTYDINFVESKLVKGKFEFKEF